VSPEEVENQYDDQKLELALNQFGGSIGGPIVQSRTHFFVSYEGLKQRGRPKPIANDGRCAAAGGLPHRRDEHVQRAPGAGHEQHGSHPGRECGVVMRSSMINEVTIGYNRPEGSATAFANRLGYDPVGVSLSGTVTSASIDARGSSGIARGGLLIRASSAASTVGSVFEPSSMSIGDTLTWNRGAHTLKAGGEYRSIQSSFQFLGSTEITYNSVNDFIDNRPNAVAVALDSPMFKPVQHYLIGFVQDSWRATDKLTFDLGLRRWARDQRQPDFWLRLRRVQRVPVECHASLP
jgi:hypothetical protein